MSYLYCMVLLSVFVTLNESKDTINKVIANFCQFRGMKYVNLISENNYPTQLAVELMKKNLQISVFVRELPNQLINNMDSIVILLRKDSVNERYSNTKIHLRRPFRFFAMWLHIFVSLLCSKKLSNLAQTLKYVSSKMSVLVENKI